MTGGSGFRKHVSSPGTEPASYARTHDDSRETSSEQRPNENIRHFDNVTRAVVVLVLFVESKDDDEYTEHSVRIEATLALTALMENYPQVRRWDRAIAGL